MIPSLPSTFTKTRIERGPEAGPFTKVGEVDLVGPDGNSVTQWFDDTGNRGHTYLVRGFDPTSNIETDFILGYFALTPKEFRLINYVKNWVPEVLVNDLTDQTISQAFTFAINSFNVHPPLTDFTINNFPRSYEQFLIMGAQINIALLKYLKLSIRDFSYNDMGFSLNIDRGTKMSKAAEEIGRIYHETLPLAKWNLTPMGIGLGTLPLPISVGASLSRGLLNVLDIMTQMSR